MRIALEVMFFALVIGLLYSMFKAPQFWKSVFSDGGVGSFSRVTSAFITVCVLAWISFIVYETHKIPSTDAIALVPMMLAFYGTNVLSGVATKAIQQPAKPQQTIVADHAEVAQSNQ